MVDVVSGERVWGVDSAGFDVAGFDHGWRWGPVTITRLASIDGRGVVLDVSTEAGSIEVWASPSGQSMTVDVRQTNRREPWLRDLVHHWKIRGRNRGRRGWQAAQARRPRPVTRPADNDPTQPEGNQQP